MFTLTAVFPDPPACTSYSADQFRASVRTLAAEVAGLVEGKVDVRFVAVGTTSSISRELADVERASDFIVVDCSSKAPGLSFALGLIIQGDKPFAVVRSDRSSKGGLSLEVDVSELSYIEFREVSELSSALAQDVAKKLIAKARSDYAAALMQKVWFDAPRDSMRVVCPPSFDDLDSANLRSPNHIYLDNFGDKDAFVEIAIFLAKTYGIHVVPVLSDRFEPRRDFRSDLVVLGGPGAPGEGGNRLTAELMKRVNCTVTYDLQGASILFGGREAGSKSFTSSFDERGYLRTDFGYFGRFPNPFSPGRVCIMIHGIHTSGVLGAVQAFTDGVAGPKNAKTVLSLGQAESLFFEAIMRVDVFDGEVLIPTVSSDLVHLMNGLE